MLATITPLGERSRHGRWGLTVGAFLVGCTGAGILLGALCGAAGAIALPESVGEPTRLLALAIAVLAAIALDASPAMIPGLGYGSQLGLGVVTVVSSAATYVALFAAFLTAGAARGALIMGCYGAIRGLTPLAAVHVRTPQQLLALHAGLAGARGPVAGGGLLLLAAILALSLAGSLG